jgi:hypothetical protein
MNIQHFLIEIRRWRFSKYKAINFAIGLSALLIYELIGRPIYRPYIYNHQINDFHVADTMGNTLGTITTIFFLIGVLSNETEKGNYLLKVGTLAVLVFEIMHPLLGKPIDFFDIIATIITGFICHIMYNGIFKKFPPKPIILK